MKMDVFRESTKILCSAKAEEGADRLMERIQNRSLPMDILPNRYDKFSGKLEQEDYVSYCRFLKSLNGQKLLNMLEEEEVFFKYLRHINYHLKYRCMDKQCLEIMLYSFETGKYIA